jgi:hypothetical protein
VNRKCEKGCSFDSDCQGDSVACINGRCMAY